jgi:signal transduction histidine kinase/CheY-like chemotaxis protein
MLLRIVLSIVFFGAVSTGYVAGKNADSISAQQLNLEFKQNYLKNLVWTFTNEHPATRADTNVTEKPLRLKSNELDTLLRYNAFNNHGWLSSSFYADSNAAGEPLYVTFYNSNPVKVWLNGKLVLQAGNPSTEKQLERAPFFNKTTVTGVTLPFGYNTLLVEFSTHNNHLFFFDYRILSIGMNLNLTGSEISYNKLNQGILFGGAALLLLLLFIIHAFLTYKSIDDYPIYVSLCTFFTLFNSFVNFSDILFKWTFSYTPFFSIAFPVSFILALYFYLLSVRKILNISIQHKYYISILVILISGTIFSVLFYYLVGLLSFLIVSTVIFFAVSIHSLVQAYKFSKNQRVGILAAGLIITTFGALSYVFVYLTLGIRSEFLFYMAVLLGYSGIPVSLTLYVIQRYSDLFYSLEQKVKERTESLAKSMRFKNDFLTNISHEFITPLTICKNIIHLNKSQSNLKLAQQKDLDLIEDNLNRLHNMVRQLLELTQSDQSQLRLQKSKLNAVELYKETVESFLPLFSAKNISLKTYFEVESASIEGDRERIRIILTNLISNAVKYSPDGGAISIRTDIRNGLLYFSIQDSGPGIPSGMEEVIFDRFHRIQQQTQDYVEGTGIGLELSRTLARLHQGDIIADPDNRKGALFHFYMPLPDADEDAVRPFAATEKKKQIELQTPMNPKRFEILLVEDNADMRRTVSRILESVGDIHTAENGAEALSLLQHLRPDIIITDLMMPVMNGNEFVKKLSRNPAFSQIPILILTAKNLGDEKTELLKTGVIDYLTKPFNPEHFLLKVRNLLRLYENRKRTVILESTESIQELTSLHQQLATYILEHIDDSTITLERLADHFLQSRRTLYRAIETETGMTPGEFIREIRLQKALGIVQTKPSIRLDELAYSVGYKTSSGFRKAFMERYGFHPTKSD